ncbi:MAG: tyrosine-type recombinase/integrase [Acidimicrobiales bacterium]|jgi:integrase/recombinase XerD
MSADLRAAAGGYLEQRRVRGYKLIDEGALLMSFVEAMQAKGIEQITVAEALAFAQRDPKVSRATHAWRLGVIRAFTVWLRAADPAASEPIPQGLIRGGYQRVTPYLYSLAQVEQLMAAARKLPERYLADAMYVLIGLLYVTGLRSGEAFGLNVEDLDCSRLILSIRGKLDRHRLVPLHPSTAEELRAYCGGRMSGPLLVGRSGQRLAPNAAHGAYRSVLATCELAPQQGARSPRLHDFRHSLAVDSLVDAHHQGLDIDARIAVLSTFLGHKDPLHTYWYLTASPQLMSTVSDRMAAALKRRSQ